MSKNKFKKHHPKKFQRPLGFTDVPDNEELKYLEKIVLGNTTSAFEDHLSEDDSEDEISPKKPRQDKAEKKPAWVDEEDNFKFKEVVQKQGKKLVRGVSNSSDYQTIIKKKFQNVMGVPKWAVGSNKNENSAENLLNTCGKFISKPKFLTSNFLQFKKLKNLNTETHIEGPMINVVKFHPKSTVAMVAGMSGVVSLFQVNGKENVKLQSLKFKKYPIDCGSFLKNGEELLIGSKNYRFFYCHNLMTGKSFKIDHSKLNGITKTKNFCVSPNDDFIAVCGNTGKIYILAVPTKEYVDFLQMNGEVTALGFNQDGSFLYSHGDEGVVYVWDMKSRTCLKKFNDDGCLTGTSVALSNNDQFIACGSSSGVVNIYDRERVHSEGVMPPTKTFYNIVTSVTSSLFNSSSEILAIASREKNNIIKLVHCPSMSVFPNFPNFNSKMNKVLCVDFSPNSGFFAVGDSRGSAHLFRLKHYGNY